MSVPDRELEHSPLSGRVTREGVTVEVLIYRFADTDDEWQLEVVDHEGGSTVWEETFPTDQQAYAEFCQTVEQDGIGSFVDPAETRH